MFSFGAESKMMLLNFLARLFSSSDILGRYFASNTSDAMIREAISEKKLLCFDYDGYRRIVELHVYGRKSDRNGIMVFQIGGQSSSGRLGWKRMYMKKITNMRVLDETFPGMRPVTGQHSLWDFIYFIVD